MSKLQATVSKILPFSCVDGPGNRLVIFLQGCNFNCKTCHNPHTMGLCNDCGICVPQCPEQALAISAEGKIKWDSTRCTACDRCLEVCPESSNPKTTQFTVKQLITVIEDNAPFLTGITVSGGEATMQLPFIIELFKNIKQHEQLKHLTCFVDSNGHLAEKSWFKLAEYCDGIMLDLKAWHAQTHQWLTGRLNHRTIQSIRILADIGKLHEIRLLYIPDQSDFIEHIYELCQLLNSLPEDVIVRINAFSTHGVSGEGKNWAPCTKQELTDFIEALKARCELEVKCSSALLSM